MSSSELAPRVFEGRVVRRLFSERAPCFLELAQMACLLVLDRPEPPHVREPLELPGQVAIELDRPERQSVPERPSAHSIRSSSTSPSGPATTMSARAIRSGGASLDATATFTPTSSSS